MRAGHAGGGGGMERGRRVTHRVPGRRLTQLLEAPRPRQECVLYLFSSNNKNPGGQREEKMKPQVKKSIS